MAANTSSKLECTVIEEDFSGFASCVIEEDFSYMDTSGR